MRTSLLMFVVAALLAVGCGGTQTFGLTSDDNNRQALGQALAMRKVAAKPGPENSTGKPMLFAVLSGKQRKLIAFDLAAGKAAWTVDADVQSRVAIGGDFVVAREGTQLVARSISDGAVRWKHAISGDMVGATADSERAFLVTAHTTGTKPFWRIAALSGGSGSELWSEDAPGQLGAPEAQGGIVMSPFLTQWLSLLDARTGAPITRIRGIDEEIGFVRTTSDGAWFGSKSGVFRLDERAASGQRADASYGSVPLPKQLGKARWGADSFDPVQAGYSASDRTRILWRTPAKGGDGPLQFQDGGVAVHYFRFLFGYNVKGEMQWAYSHPRVELVASEHLGSVLGAVSARGELIAIDPATGVVKWSGSLGADGGAQVLGATFDADGWNPQGEVTGEAGTLAALVAIARDRDARFAEVKELAVAALASLPGREISTALLAMVQDERTPPKLRETAVEALVARRDAGALDAYATALAIRWDFIQGTRPVAVGEIARVIAGLGGSELDGEDRKQAVAALIIQLESPQTGNPELTEIVRALAAIGGGAELPALRRQLLAYRADPSFAGDTKLVKALVDALLAHGGAEDRETLVFVAEDPRTDDAVAAYARTALTAR